MIRIGAIIQSKCEASVRVICVTLVLVLMNTSVHK